ncbi:bifunctional preprotein translocase subunit SecD/SecF [Rosistilla carotiformis]|uniref:Multifunctional fusion protein n=1 Tax=Rosistilla carotiformis TaxID=2528017 RepID=A0A518JRM7_9BACT|nr:protein translocase subunit SecD [Rosistilla carotiformis]QDV68177.1 bifunctional preprotein translocase subunit SecD/SecF [Rosistilla carotiformis]
MLDLNVIETLLAQAEPGKLGTQIGIIAIMLAVLIVPFLVGAFLAKSFRMPNYGTRIGVVLFAMTAAAATITFGQLKYGVDLKGGTILVYEIDPTAGGGESEDPSSRVTAEELVGALTERINPSGTQEIVIRPYGDRQIEIIVPNVEESGVNEIKDKVQTAGMLRFAIVANERDHLGLIETVRATGPTLDDVVKDDAGEVIGRWVKVDRENEEVLGGLRPLRVDVSGDIIRDSRTGTLLSPQGLQGENGLVKWLSANGIEDIDVLMRIEKEFDITGEDLAIVASDHDGQGNPAVRFTLNAAGKQRFYVLTLNNAPDGSFLRRLGIVLDDKLLSAPVIRSPINGDGQITGNFSRAEVEFLVGILRAGRLPAALSKQPISENQIGSTLGDDTIDKGVMSIGTAFVLVLAFIAIYYRFSGLVACVALLLNLAMILAMMILINQPATLPGLAGLVLTVGMSVDANVLIFERIREELKRGAAPRMAIRNGFGRATTTIVDANLTTLITAIVLYAIGTDQIRGFAVALILGILFSMFTAIYVSRTFFDIAERWGKANLTMSDFITSIRGALTGNDDFDFIGKRAPAFVLSGILLIAGIIALAYRGSSIFDIDFAGGTSVTFWLQEEAEADDVRKIVEASLNTDPESKVQFSLNRVDMAGMKNRVFAIYTSVEDVDDLKHRIRDGFESAEGLGLVTFETAITEGDAEPAPAAEQTGQIRRNQQPLIRTVAYRPQDEAETKEDAAAATDNEAAETPAEKSEQTSISAAEDRPKVESTSRTISLGVAGGDQNDAKINHDALVAAVIKAAAATEVPLQEEGIRVVPQGSGSEDWTNESKMGFAQWKIDLDLPEAQSLTVLNGLKSELDAGPVWLSSSKVGSRVAGDMTRRAIAAMLASLVFIVGYIWFRFQRVAFGLAAVVALVHDVLITLGAIAVSFWAARYLGFLLVDEFRISLAVVAALLTIIGYSLNDTIVVFDRIREVRGKSPKLTADMVNTSINQTLSRTLLTSLTTLIVVVLLYAFGGEGIHSFAFALTIGVIVGTYSSIFIASPTLLWLFNRTEAAPTR